MKIAEYLLGLIVICTAAYLTVTPIAESTAASLNNTAEVIRHARDRKSH